MTTKKSVTSEQFENFDKAMDKVMSVSKEELERRLAAAKQAKTGKRFPTATEPKPSH